MKTSVILASIFALAASAMPTDLVTLEERSGTKLTQAQAEKILKDGGVTWTSTGGCTTKSNPKCTSFSGIYSGTVNNAVTLKKACACSVKITGGTEAGHATNGDYTHEKGYKLDFAKNTKLNSYIKNSFTKIASRSNGDPQWKSKAGNIYCDEGNHWDVTYL